MTRVVSSIRTARAPAALAVIGVGIAIAFGGCAMNPPGPSQILSRLPEDQANAATAPPLSPEELARYDAIDRQVLFEQDQAIAAENAAQAWSRYYAPPVNVFGGYSTGGWGRGWGTGIGVGFGPRWGW
jgi:hypothetical protein